MALGPRHRCAGASRGSSLSRRACRSSIFQQLRDVLFASVGQHALRNLAIRTFAHVHRLDLGYHLARKTGALSRIVDRGIKAIEFLLRFMLFSILPLIVELSIVAAISRIVQSGLTAM